MKQLAGTPVSLSVISAAPTSEPGTAVAPHADGFRESRARVRVTLSGGTSVECVLWLHDADGWSRAGDTGNLGLLGAQALPTGASYVFGVTDLGMFDAAILVTNNNVGGVTVTATIASVLERES